MSSKRDIKQYRAIGHKLNPVVTVAGNGLSETVMLELERALDDHELIKVKLAVGERDTRQAVAAEICEKTRAELIQSIGGVVVLLRRNTDADPAKSNLQRF